MFNKKKYTAYIVYDLETGGMKSEKNPILELAFVVLLRDKKGKLYIDESLSFDSLVIPYNNDLKIEEQALKVNNIKMKDIKKYGNDVENVKEVLLEMLEIVNHKNEERYRPVLVGHNIQKFDNDFLQKFLKDIGAPDMYSIFSKSSLDTLELTRFLFEGENVIKSFSLNSLCEFFKIERKQKHRAKDDAIATAKLFMLIGNMFNIEKT